MNKFKHKNTLFFILYTITVVPTGITRGTQPTYWLNKETGSVSQGQWLSCYGTWHRHLYFEFLKEVNKTCSKICSVDNKVESWVGIASKTVYWIHYNAATSFYVVQGIKAIWKVTILRNVKSSFRSFSTFPFVSKKFFFY